MEMTTKDDENTEEYATTNNDEGKGFNLLRNTDTSLNSGEDVVEYVTTNYNMNWELYMYLFKSLYI